MRLVKGEGSEATGACWMSAIHWYTRGNARTWTDHPECVSPVIRELCVVLNDLCSDGEREEMIGPHLFTPLGTNTGKADEQKRMFLCADRAVRVFAPMALDAAGLKNEAKKLRDLPPITDKESARAAAAVMAAYAAEAAAAAYAAEAAAGYAAEAAAVMAAEAAAVMAAEAAAAYAARAARAAAAYAARAARAAAARAAAADIKRELLRLILDCCEIGTKKEIVPTKTREEVLSFLERK